MFEKPVLQVLAPMLDLQISLYFVCSTSILPANQVSWGGSLQCIQNTWVIGRSKGVYKPLCSFQVFSWHVAAEFLGHKQVWEEKKAVWHSSLTEWGLLTGLLLPLTSFIRSHMDEGKRVQTRKIFPSMPMALGMKLFSCHCAITLLSTLSPSPPTTSLNYGEEQANGCGIFVLMALRGTVFVRY